jgi:hypothetical protein
MNSPKPTGIQMRIRISGFDLTSPRRANAFSHYEIPHARSERDRA